MISLNDRQFWNENPALLLGVSFLIGSAFSLYSFPLWLAIPWLIYVLNRQRWSAASAMLLSALYSLILIGNLPHIEQPISCTAAFTPAMLQHHQSPFHRDLQMQGTLFYEGCRLPCTIYLPSKNRPTVDGDLLLTGLLTKRSSNDYVMKIEHFKPIANSFSLAELRFQTKERLRRFLFSKLSKPSATLLSSLATGEVEDRSLRYHFSRLGLQHILAISGFHFALLVSFFSALLSLFLPHRTRWLALLALTSLYFIFIGSSPAVQRAWITASLFLLAKLLSRQTSGINLLGASLLIELILNPLIASNLGFQLSFGCSLGILLLFSPIDRLLRPMFPARTLRQASFLSIPSQLIYFAGSSLRSAIAITLAVNAAILPLLLHHFGKFPYLSLLYNLFFPALISISMFLLIASLLLHLIWPSLAEIVFYTLDMWTKTLLDLTMHPPLILDYSLYLHFPMYAIPIYLLGLWLFMIRYCAAPSAPGGAVFR